MGWQRTDDLDNGPGEQRTFGLDGKAYVVDLGPGNHGKLIKALQPFLTVATVYGELPVPPEFPGPATPLSITNGQPVVVDKPTAKPRGRRGKQSVSVPQATIREWANANGYQVSPKGRIPNQVMEAFTTAHA